MPHEESQSACGLLSYVGRVFIGVVLGTSINLLVEVGSNEWVAVCMIRFYFIPQLGILPSDYKTGTQRRRVALSVSLIVLMTLVSYCSIYFIKYHLV